MIRDASHQDSPIETNSIKECCENYQTILYMQWKTESWNACRPVIKSFEQIVESTTNSHCQQSIFWSYKIHFEMHIHETMNTLYFLSYCRIKYNWYIKKLDTSHSWNYLSIIVHPGSSMWSNDTKGIVDFYISMCLHD